MRIKITCINKDNGDHDDPNEAITNLGWTDRTGRSGIMSLQEMVQFLDNSNNSAYVEDSSGNIAYLEIRTSGAGNKFVKTVADGKETNNLLSLPECLR